jgi:SNF2 family DNA or RNA helicase
MGGIGLTLTAASYVIYYSNSFSLEDRLQSEDRAHRKGQTKSVTYIDIMMDHIIDKQIVTALKNKKSVADFVEQSIVRNQR